MKILIIRFSSIGDIVWTSPIVRCCKEQIKDAEIHFLTKSKFSILIENNPYIDKIHLFDNQLEELIVNLKKEKYDLIIDLHNNLRSSIIKLRLGVRSFTFKKYPLQYYLFTKFRIDLLPKNHVIDRFFGAIKPLGINNDLKGIDFFIDPKSEVNLDDFPIHFKSGRYKTIIIGASKATKKMPPEKIIELCQKINSPVILIGGPEDLAAGSIVKAYFDNQPFGDVLIENACGKFSIAQSASLIRQSKDVFGHDTGLTHIAAAFHKRIYSIWGNTVPGFGMYPYGVENVFIEHLNLPCRPCSKLGSDICPQVHFKCMKELSFEKVVI